MSTKTKTENRQFMPKEGVDLVLDRADEILIAAMNREVLPGMAVGIIQGETLIYAKGFGLADIEREKPVTTDTVFRIGSIAKTLTAIALMQLWEQDKFQLDDPVNEYLKAYKIKHRDPNAPPVTFRHLLTHTSGIGELREVADLFRPAFGLGSKPNQPIPTLNEYYASGLTSEVKPGTKWAYSNHAFATVGQLVEDISNEPFVEYMISHVFDPLGMTHTDYLLSDRIKNQLAQGYVFKKCEFKPVDYLENLVKGAGSVFSNINDMAKYVAALLNGGKNQFGRILKPETLQLMMQPHYQPDSHLPAMGLAFFLDRFDGHRVVGHDGGWPGFGSFMLMAPDDGLGVVVFTNTLSVSGNSSNFAPRKVGHDLLRRLLDIPEPASQLPRPNVWAAPHLWSQLCGFYAPAKGLNTNARIWFGLGGGVEVFVKDNRLQMRSPIGFLSKPVTLYSIDASDPFAFQALQEDKTFPVVFKRNTTGDIDCLHMSAFSAFYTLYKRSQFQNPQFWLVGILGVLAVFSLAIWRENGLLMLIVAFLGWQILNRQGKP